MLSLLQSAVLHRAMRGGPKIRGRRTVLRQPKYTVFRAFRKAARNVCLGKNIPRGGVPGGLQVSATVPGAERSEQSGNLTQ